MNRPHWDDVSELLLCLNEREKQVICERFGLEDGKAKTLKETGKIVGLSANRVRDYLARAGWKLRRRHKRNEFLMNLNNV